MKRVLTFNKVISEPEIVKLCHFLSCLFIQVSVGNYLCNFILVLPSETTPKYLRGMDTLSGEATLSKLFCLPSEMGSTLKGNKNCSQGEQILSF